MRVNLGINMSTRITSRAREWPKEEGERARAGMGRHIENITKLPSAIHLPPRHTLPKGAWGAPLQLDSHCIAEGAEGFKPRQAASHELQAATQECLQSQDKTWLAVPPALHSGENLLPKAEGEFPHDACETAERAPPTSVGLAMAPLERRTGWGVFWRAVIFGQRGAVPEGLLGVVETRRSLGRTGTIAPAAAGAGGAAAEGCQMQAAGAALPNQRARLANLPAPPSRSDHGSVQSANRVSTKLWSLAPAHACDPSATWASEDGPCREPCRHRKSPPCVCCSPSSVKQDRKTTKHRAGGLTCALPLGGG